MTTLAIDPGRILRAVGLLIALTAVFYLILAALDERRRRKASREHPPRPSHRR